MKKIYFKKNGVIKESKEGFAWDVLVWGPVAPLMRGDFKNAVVLFVLLVLFFGIGNIAFAFKYNEMYNEDLIAEGWKRCDENGKILIADSKKKKGKKHVKEKKER